MIYNVVLALGYSKVSQLYTDIHTYIYIYIYIYPLFFLKILFSYRPLQSIELCIINE